MADIKNHSTLPTNLVAFWDLEEPSGSRYDLVGDANLTDNGTVGQTTGKDTGNAANFVRANSESLSTTDTQTDITSDFSFSCWVKFTSITSGQLRPFFGKDGSASTRSYASWLFNSGGTHQLKIFISSNGSNSEELVVTPSTGNFSTGTWYHIVGTWDASASQAEFYVNGSSVGTATGSYTAISNTSATWYMGRFGNYSGDYTDAAMMDFGLWDKVLSSSEASDLYNSGTRLQYYDPDDVKNDTDLSTSLVSYWELEEASGTRTDSHGSNDLTDNNTVGNATGIQGNGADFERDNTEYLSISDASQSGLDITGDMTISMWVKVETALTSGLIEYQLYNKYQPSGNNRSFSLAYIYNGGTPALQVITSANGSSINFGNRTQTLTAGTWYHIVCLYDASASSCEIFVDSSSIGTISSLDSSLYNSAAPVQIGAQNGSFTMDGIIDEVAVYSKALSVGEIRALYGYGTPPEYEAAGGGAANNAIFFGGM